MPAAFRRQSQKYWFYSSISVESRITRSHQFSEEFTSFANFQSISFPCSFWLFNFIRTKLVGLSWIWNVSLFRMWYNESMLCFEPLVQIGYTKSILTEVNRNQFMTGFFDWTHKQNSDFEVVLPNKEFIIIKNAVFFKLWRMNLTIFSSTGKTSNYTFKNWCPFCVGHEIK